jgi:hypothetical protein
MRTPSAQLPVPGSGAVYRIPLPAPGPPYDDRAGADPGPPVPVFPAEDPVPVVPVPRPDGPRWPGQFAQALAETLTGARASRQIASWTTERARRQIQQLGPALRTHQRPLVRRVITCEPGPGVVEMTVIVTIGDRTRALAVRLERARPGRDRPGPRQEWLCTAIEAA